MDAFSSLPDFCVKPRLILGCGNRLFGDDGFGGVVVDHLVAHYHIPNDIYLMDVGTGVRRVFFTLCLCPSLPQEIIIIDAVDKGRRPGEIFEIALDDIPSEKADDFSLHQAPSSNLAKDLQSMGVRVSVLVCQVSRFPAQIEIGLSEPVSRAASQMSGWVASRFALREKSPTEIETALSQRLR